jgi:hypothetical protein
VRISRHWLAAPGTWAIRRGLRGSVTSTIEVPSLRPVSAKRRPSGEV